MSDPHVHWSHKEEKYWIRDGDDILWFDGPLEAKEAARMLERKHTAQAERARIVAWLREEEERISRFAGYGVWAADAIEAGEHLK
jgi:hypothetical protein